MRIALLAGTHSGCGKTTVMLALLQYLQARQFQIRAFKTGPDFLDPLWHLAVTGKPSYNLDTEMIGIEQSRRLLGSVIDGELALIEGVMGMFDGKAGVGQAGSSVDLARQLAVPVVLVVDAQGMAGSIAAMVAGYVDYARRCEVLVSGVVANRVSGDFHANLLREALADCGLPPLLAWLRKQERPLQERHLGLSMPTAASRLSDLELDLDLDEAALVEAFGEFAPVAVQPAQKPLLPGKTIAIARDGACCFVYPANVDWLREQGAKVVYFSPLAGEPVPDADALWLPGGYPELYAGALAESPSLTSIKAFIESGKPTLAECGGAMLLGKALIDQAGTTWPMANVLPFVSRMQDSLAALGYRRETSGMRGHEFHFSVREWEVVATPAFVMDAGDCGIRYKNLRASYVHWYFASAPAIAAQWLS